MNSAYRTFNKGSTFILLILYFCIAFYNTHTFNNSSNEEFRHNDVTWNRENIEAVITYKHIIKPETSDITLRGSVSKIWGHRPSYYYLDQSPVNRSNSGGSPFILSIQGDYKRKVRFGTFTSGAKLTYRRNDIFHEFYSYDTGQWMLVFLVDYS